MNALTLDRASHIKRLKSSSQLAETYVEILESIEGFESQ